MKKKVSYIDLLKEAISEYDVKSFDYKGPMTEPILGYTGDGEMETHKDAASILERYYFNENNDSGINVMEQTAETDDPEEKNEIVTGDTPDDIDETMDDFEDIILDDETSITEDLDFLGEEEEILGDKEEVEEPKDKKEKKEGEEEEEEGEKEEAAMESAILEKLIEEMENEEDGPGVTDGDQGDVEAAEDEPLDVDKEVKKGVGESFPIGPLSKASGKSDRTAKEEIEEAFRIFREEIVMEEDDGETPAGNEEAGAAGKEKALGSELDAEDLGLQKEDLDFLGEDFMLEEEESEEGEKSEEEDEVKSSEVKA